MIEAAGFYKYITTTWFKAAATAPTALAAATPAAVPDRKVLRRFFEVDAEFTVLATLHALAEKGQLDKCIVAKAITDLDVNPGKIFPEVRS